MRERCLDASVVIKLALRGEPHRAVARRLVRDSTAAGVMLIAPPFFECEVDSVISRRVYEGRLSPRAAQRAYAVLDRAPVRLVADPLVRPRARELATRYGQRTVYDCTYAALAELRECDFWTADRSFYEAVHAALPFVRYLPSYP